jgi:outer membrane murein-binding lipoprotein Lpp
MLRIKSNLNFVVVMAAIVGLIFLVGCGNSKEKEQMTAFIQELGAAVQEYAKAEDAQKAELEAKINSLMEKWTEMKMEMGEEITPQVLDKLDSEFQKLAKEFKTLSSKS